MRWGSVAAALCLLVGGALLSNIFGGFGNGGGFFGGGDATVYAAHREDFPPEIDSAILAQFEDPTEVKKAYLMRTNEWFLADGLTDFSQAVTTDVVYVAPGGEDPTDSDAAYSIYSVDEAGTIQWSCTAYPPESELVPFAFSGLTYPMIHAALVTLEHEDYILTYAPQMGTVFIWVRDTATLCFESACGSGTLACALAEHAASGATDFAIVQPSGSALSVRMENTGQGWDVWVGGPARLTACGETELTGLL